MAAGDLNQDGLPDVAVIDGRGLVCVLLQGADQLGVFQQPVSYLSQSSPSAVAIGDCNADGRMDLVYLDDGGIEIRLQHAITPGSFGTPVVLAKP